MIVIYSMIQLCADKRFFLNIYVLYGLQDCKQAVLHNIPYKLYFYIKFFISRYFYVFKMKYNMLDDNFQKHVESIVNTMKCVLGEHTMNVCHQLTYVHMEHILYKDRKIIIM